MPYCSECNNWVKIPLIEANINGDYQEYCTKKCHQKQFTILDRLLKGPKRIQSQKSPLKGFWSSDAPSTKMSCSVGFWNKKFKNEVQIK